MQNLVKRQQGMTLIGWVIVLLLIAFFVTLILRLFPIYMENYQIKSILKSFDEEPNLSAKSKHDVRRMIGNKLYINGIKTIDMYSKKQEEKDKVKVTKQDGTLTINVIYEVRTPIFFNIDAVVSFDNKYEANFH